MQQHEAGASGDASYVYGNASDHDKPSASISVRPSLLGASGLRLK